MDLFLNNKTALITGASKGIGKAIAESLAQEGCNLALTARSGDMLEDVKATLQKKHNISVEIFPIDLSLKNSAEQISEFAGNVDILINNAGAIPPGELTAIDEEAWREAWNLKVFGYINLCRLFYGKMKEVKSGVILNIIGAAAVKPMYAYIAGTTGNAGLTAFTKALSNGSTYNGVRVLGISPGLTASDRMVTMMRGQAKEKLGDEERWEELFKDLPFGRAAKAEEVADLATFLVSPRSNYTSGTVITLDAGVSNH
ncbi:MAG: short-chain dehydrogenase [Rhodospirillaceae bacterium]|nr:short-chain dehydrogenase [Rhodospirillaceae bacterium]|tara:strand:+ start:131 stop:901 length:771 start_codon:yes stop_codon:yes gene_type:complete